LKELARKALAFVLLAALALSVFFSLKARASAQDFSSQAKGMIVLERQSGRVLNEKNADLRLPMASTTKIATAITVIENTTDLNKAVEVPAEAEGVEGSSIYLKAGEKLKIIDLLYGLMLQSGNDCAVALAKITAGSVNEFALLMNETALKAGATQTNFVTPHGLHDENHYTTARDLAKITAYAMNNETFRKIVSTKKYTCAWENHDYDRVILNKNKLLANLDGADGVKTGYTKKAGRCLVASATRNGMSVIAVVLNCGPMFEECSALINEAFLRYEMVSPYKILQPEIKARVLGGKEDFVQLKPIEEKLYPLTDDEIKSLSYKAQGVQNMKAPVKIGTENGKIEFFTQNKLLFQQKLFTINKVSSLSVSDRLGELIDGWNE
jgi:D-alanyl-D-alanine carboxypeptidase (penicillin-binding protein 5/6)